MKKMNNKGFSLVELIVVMAIMAILAVTLAPKLTHYIEKARLTNDRETINTIYTAVKYGMMDEKISSAGLALASVTGGLHLGDGNTSDAVHKLYEITGNQWKFDSSYADKDNIFIEEIKQVVGQFKLQSNKASTDTKIVITATSQDDMKVELFYNGIGGEADYKADSSAVRP